MEEIQEIIAAFLDDERVDVEALKRALALPEGRDYLVDLLALRELADEHADTLGKPTEAIASRSPIIRRVLLSAAAVLLSVSTLAGYLVGHRLGRGTPATVTQPSQDPSRSGTAISPVTAPVPTRVIRLLPGVDWNERSGGN